MSKKIIALLLTSILLFACVCIPVNAEEDNNWTPAITITKRVKAIVNSKYIFSENSDLSKFGVEVELLDRDTVAFDGATTDSRVSIISISSHRDGQEAVFYDEANPEPFFDVFRFTKTDDKGNILRDTLPVDIVVQIDYRYAEVFGDLKLKTTINGFSTPPDVGIDLGEAVAVPEPIENEFDVNEFPALTSLSVSKASEKMFYTDGEKPDLEGVCVNVTTSSGLSGKVTYSPASDHMFTTIPNKNQKLVAADGEEGIDGTTQIATYFFDRWVSSIPVYVDHAWSGHLVSITTDKYVEGPDPSNPTKPGYHAEKCNGCGKTRNKAPHKVNPYAWIDNNDATLTANGTAHQDCLDCGATLTKDVLGSAGYNTAFANYHFLKVIFDYINFLLRIIGGAGN